MAQDIYDAIQAQAPAGSSAAAGNLHEEIWVELLRRSDPAVHNVRVTAGDGGIDGVGFQDPVAGLATVYQCKFFKDISSKGHRTDLTQAFVRACSHPFECNSWILLLPRQLSAGDLGWLVKDLRNEATALATQISKAKVVAKKAKAPKLPRITLPADIHRRLSACAIHYREGQDLEDLLRRHLDVAGRFLPDSAIALMDRMNKQRHAFDLERRNAWNLVDELRAESIRKHQIEARRANAAIGILNQGWGSLAERLRLTTVDEGLPGAGAAQLAADAEALAGARTAYAFQCEGLIPGVSDTLSQIFYEARLLKNAAELRGLGLAQDDVVASTAATLLTSIEKLQALIAVITRARYQRARK